MHGYQVRFVVACSKLFPITISTKSTRQTKMMPGSKIVLPSSNVDDYTATALRSTISHIVNPTSKLLSPSPSRYRAKNSLDYLQV